ncbi:MAG: hypothetical protein A2504_13050 [Bdellovibrionales bacterium RIFOXYD12_FULL_39_22]|nr:MAG: hypothetical protein A2385_00850 [Bdellovibrionales bacterium RIFOXYB1_FULL_39_21]OFZ43556.1 MAG: hypothetical protein A2485_12520 [Bdellovibrionales bacterium RIFOXYC12_FULL_39_17]OFZ44575.1 MAG: hypothetical protein A2404_10210 [Bdellovibrionales bacterium RIFOXYC1_FULL_39_130]OFZ76334.1 MAG: hypothetical protein A2560_06830 [Bdellovibrionales bacterium RIFOXYD1_FULL_39_84]OFZ94600.1 MAG: hypothetical protein A2504_13050 [Bdellovibrionales bacterium RIFOXYD12_FULL_39_22]HLE12946.1 hy
MPSFELLGSLMRDLHREFVRIYYLMLPVFFLLSVAVTWFRHPQGSPEFVSIIKKAVVSTFLLVAFPEISQAIVSICDGIADKIDSMNSIDTIIKMAGQKTQGYSFSPTSILLQFNDLIIATLAFLSYLVLYVARYLTVAMYHFFWLFFMATAPLLLLFNLFHGTEQITGNLFKGMIEVASWKIVWGVLGAMLTSLSFGDAYRAEGSYVTLMVMNFMIAISMLMTPMIVRSIVGSGFHAMSSTIGASTVAAMAAAPAKALIMSTKTRSAINLGQNFMRQKLMTPKSKKE